MAERDTGARTTRPVLLVGAGRRAREAGAALAALSALDDRGEKRHEPLAELDVADLEELLTARSGAPQLVEGLLILESGRVPLEDIGFVRRFLERHAGWRLAVIGEDPQEARLRGLLALVRAQWLPWPPDLEQLAALLVPGAVREPAGTPAPAREEKGAPSGAPGGRRAVRRASPGSVAAGVPVVPVVNGGIDVAGLLEELLAGAALQGEGATRYQFHAQRTPLVTRERGALQEGLGGLLDLARRCAGAEGLVKADVDPAGDAVRIAIDFPSAGLAEKDLPGLLDETAGDPAGSELAEGVAAARHGAALLREAGGRVELASAGPGRVRCEIRLSAQAPARPARAGKPEDPFA